MIILHEYENSSKPKRTTTAAYFETQFRMTEIRCPMILENIDKNDNYFQNLLSEKKDPRKIVNLSLCSKHLHYLPESFFSSLENLTRLDLSDNKLKNAPHSLKYLTQLEYLDLSNNCIRHLPLTITEITSLATLNLSNNCLKALPESIGDLKSLETLVLRKNELSDLPQSCENLNCLRILDLSSNFIKLIPKCICKGMKNLESLDVSGNFYINISHKPSSLKLKKFYAKDSRGMAKFPIWILTGDAPSLEVLNLDGSTFKLFDFPNNCAKSRIKNLSIQRCCFYDPFLQQLMTLTDNLVTLKAGNGDSKHGGNYFWRLPIDYLHHPEIVKQINVRASGLPAIPQTIKKFSNLVELDLGCNSLCWLTEDICELSNLQILLVDDNQLSSLPEKIGRMSSLRELRASKNHLCELPKSMRKLRNLSFLDLYDNDFEVLSEHLEHIDNLTGLDLDGNLVEINNCRIRDNEYENMRKRMRTRCELPEGLRQSGPRYERQIEGQSDTNSEISSVDLNEWNTEKTVISKDETDWDVSDDSADEFDPIEYSIDPTKFIKVPYQPFNYAAAMARRLNFCPADLHALPIKQQIAQMREKGLIKPNIHDTIVEGQFDDA